jgi:hypothetical protein
MSFVGQAAGAIASPIGSVMGGMGGAIAADAPQNSYRAGDQEQIDLDKQKASSFYSGLPDELNAQANGTGPSAADAYLQNANQQATNSANALAQSARGGVSPAMALRMAQNSSANASATNAGTYGAMKNQEAINAINQKGQLTGFYDQLGQQGTMQAQGINAGITGTNTTAAANFGGQGMATIGSIAGAAAKGGGGGGAAHGGVIPGVAPLPGDHPENDISPVKVSPGEGVIPRSKMADPAKAHAFLDAMLSDGKEDDGFDALLKAHHSLKRKVKVLEATRG